MEIIYLSNDAWAEEFDGRFLKPGWSMCICITKPIVVDRDVIDCLEKSLPHGLNKFSKWPIYVCVEPLSSDKNFVWCFQEF
jgi:hypothetical protein